MYTNIYRFIMFGILSFLLAFSASWLSFSHGALYETLTNESRGAELLTAIFYIIAGGILLSISYNALKHHIPVRPLIFTILLGLFFIVVGGEEESWGQWIFEFSTPKALQSVNYQNEINVHNLEIFTGALNANYLLYRFVFLYGIIIPFAYVGLRWVRSILDKMSCPVIPVYITPVFAIAFIYRHFALNTPFPPTTEVWRHAEMTEFFIAVGFLAFAIDRFLKYKQQEV